MIQMFANDKLLVLPTDLKIRVEINSPAFETDSLPASIVYHFDLPVTPNEEIFNYANYIEVCNKFHEYPWKLRYDGFWLFTGKLIVTGVNDTFRCAATIKQLPTDFSDKELTDFAWEQIDIPSTMQSYVDSIRNGGSSTLAFPEIYAPKLYGDANLTFNGVVNSRHLVTNILANSNSVIPLFKAMHILDKIFAEQNHKVDYSNIDTNLKNLLLFNNRTLDANPPDYYAYSRVVYNPITNQLLFPTEDKYGCINIFDQSYTVKLAGQFSITIQLKGLLTDAQSDDLTRIKIVIRKHTSSSYTDIFFHERFMSYDMINTEIELCDDSMIIDCDETISKFRIVITASHHQTNNIQYKVDVKSGFVEISRIGTIEDAFERNDYLSFIKPENHIPKISVNDYLLSLKQPFGIAYFIDNVNPRLQLYMLQHLLHAKYLDLTSIFIESSMTITVTEPTTYELKYSGESIDIDIYDFKKPLEPYTSFNDTPIPYKKKLLVKVLQTNSYYTSDMIDSELIWQRLGDCFQSKKIANHTKKETIEIKMLPVSMERKNNTVYPYYEEQGISDMFTPEASPIDKIMYVFQTSAMGAGNSGISSQGSEFGVSMDMDANNGIYNKFLKEWYEFISTANEYTCNLRMDVEKMLEILNLFKPQTSNGTNQTRQIRIKNQNYIPKQFTFELTHTGITCEAKLMKNDRKR